MNKNKVLVAAAAIVCLVIAAAVFMLRPEGHLVIRDAETGETYISYPLERGEEFSITFIHSVNKTPVTDVYDVDERGIIMLRKTIYYGFGAGVPSDLDPKMELTYEEGTGAMVVSKIDMELPSFYLFVGTVSDHTLSIGGEEISLRDVCGRNTKVHISYENSRIFHSVLEDQRSPQLYAL